ncbi:ABC transporter permease [Endozoicomonadaceae bacterium StTr2]
MHKHWLTVITVLPLLTLFLLFLGLPAGIVLYNSVTLDGNLTLQHYQTIFTGPLYLDSIYRSLVITGWSSLLGILLAFSCARALQATGGRTRDWVLCFANMTTNYSGVPLAFAFTVLLGFNGMLIIILRQLGLEPDFNLYSKWGLILIYTYFQVPLGLLLLYPALDTIRTEWQEASELLGAGRFHFWIHIGIPVLMPALLGSFLILFANAMGAYATAYALTGGNYNLLVIRIATLVAGDIQLNPNLASALSVLLVVLLTIALLAHEFFLKHTYLNRNDDGK